MSLRNLLLSGCFIMSAGLLFTACNENDKIEQGKHIIINEIMASNRTGMLNHKGQTEDWIELKNTSSDTINLKGFKLQVEPTVNDSVNNKKQKASKEGEEDIDAEEKELNKDEKDPVKTWTFPDMKIPGGETMLIFAKNKKDKKDKKDNDKEKSDKEKNKDKKKGDKDTKPVMASLKFPKEGATVRFLSPRGKVISEIKYDALESDESWALQEDSTYIATRWQSPGFENTRAGYEAAMQKMDEQRQSPLLIWEVMGREANSYENWVELKNVSDKDVSLNEYSLSKKLSKSNSGWQLPDKVLKPGEIITITLAGKSRAKEPSNAPFKLGSAETVILSKDGKFMDGVSARQTLRGGSVGRMKGKKGFFYFLNPTRNAENGTDGRRFIAEPAVFNHKPGVYEKDNKLTLRLKDPSQKVHYTTNGTAPTAQSPILKDSLVLTKNTTVRTYTEGDSLSLHSKISTGTYLLGVKHEMPVVNITVNNSDLYDFNTGIYANGPGYNNEWPHMHANFWKNWTKNAHVEMFDDIAGRDGFSVDCGLKIFGGFSRAEAKKSFRLKFRGNYGDPEVKYDFFGDGEEMELEDLVLRSGSQDWMRCMIRDEFFTSLLKEHSPAVLTQKYRPVALYVNGEYFGLYYLREKIDKNFVARKLNVSNDDVDIIMSMDYREEGSRVDFMKLMDYVKANSMKNKENYEYVKQQLDLEGLIDFKLGEIYACNTDVGNVRYVRSRDPKSDRKWHLVYYDLDASWEGYTPTAAYYLSTTGGAAASNAAGHNILISRLLENPEFRDMFLQRLSYHLTNTFSTENSQRVFDSLIARIRPEMERNCERWPKLSYKTWERNIGTFSAKFKDKPKRMLDDIRKVLNVTPEEEKKYFSKLDY